MQLRLLLAEALPLQDFRVHQIYWEATDLLSVNNKGRALMPRHLRAIHLYGIR